MPNNYPIIQLTLAEFEKTICAALSEHMAELDSDIKDAVRRYCEPDNIASVIANEASRVIEHTIKQEVERHFQYGPGRTTIAQAVLRILCPEQSPNA